jgi:prevent-host-death family protein
MTIVRNTSGHAPAATATERRVPAGEFKAHCLSLLDEVALTGQSLIITKRGRAVARLVPLAEQMPAPLMGSILAERDIVTPLDEQWDAER